MSGSSVRDPRASPWRRSDSLARRLLKLLLWIKLPLWTKLLLRILRIKMIRRTELVLRTKLVRRPWRGTSRRSCWSLRARRRRSAASWLRSGGSTTRPRWIRGMKLVRRTTLLSRMKLLGVTNTSRSLKKLLWPCILRMSRTKMRMTRTGNHQQILLLGFLVFRRTTWWIFEFQHSWPKMRRCLSEELWTVLMVGQLPQAS